MAFPPNTVPPTIRAYVDGDPVQRTDAFVIDRIGVGTMYVTGQGVIDLVGGSGSSVRELTFIIDGQGSVISTGIAGTLHTDFAYNINRVTLTDPVASETGSVVVDIWAAPFASFPPTDANTIVASTPPTITTSNKYQDSTLTGWTVAIAANSDLIFNVDSVTSITKLTIALKVTLT